MVNVEMISNLSIIYMYGFLFIVTPSPVLSERKTSLQTLKE